MIHTFAALNSKGGVGKTTFLANLGGILADIGFRVLLVDADPQPSLTKCFSLGYEAPQGLVEVVSNGIVTPQCISRTSIANLDLVRSNDGDAQLQHWLHSRADRRTRLDTALRSPYVQDHYDYVLIDTQGAIGPLQTAAAFAAGTLISPLPPDAPSVREFRTGTLRALQRLATDEKEPRADLAPIRAVICKLDNTRDAKEHLQGLANEFSEDDRVTLLNTVIPSSVAYREAFKLGMPVHRFNTSGGSKTPFEVMHRIVWELQPQLYGHFAGRKRGDPDLVFGRASSPLTQGEGA